MKKAFTLLELTVVIALIGLLFAFAAVSFVSFGNKVSLRSAGDRVAATLRLAQQRAISEKEVVVIEFTQKDLPANIKILNPMTVKFSSSGRPIPGYFGTLVLSDGKHEAKIVISPMGRVRIE